MIRRTSLGLAMLFLSAELPCSAQSTPILPSVMPVVDVTVFDTDSGQSLSNSSVQVQILPPDHDRPCLPNANVQPTSTFAVTTDSSGSFSLTAPGGDHMVKIAVPQRAPIFGCIYIDTADSASHCGIRLSRHQQFIVRVTESIPGFPGDIVGSSACAPYRATACDPLLVPNVVNASLILLVDPRGNPIPGASLEFRVNSKGKGRLVGNVRTNAGGIADVSTVSEVGGLMQMSVHSDHASGTFLMQFRKAATSGRQTIKLFQWRCQGNVMKGALVRP